MRKIIVLSFISLDGVMQAPGGPQEDPTAGFTYGGWSVPYFDEFVGKAMVEQMSGPFDLLLGRKTYEIFAAHWPYQKTDEDPIAAAINNARKYVVSRSSLQLGWNNSIVLQGDLIDEINRLKQQDGPELQVHGSGNLIQTLLRHDLIDEFWLKIFPVTLGVGKRLFADGTTQAAFALRQSKASSSGVIIAAYERAGTVKTGPFVMEKPTAAELTRRQRMREEN